MDGSLLPAEKPVAVKKRPSFISQHYVHTMRGFMVPDVKSERLVLHTAEAALVPTPCTPTEDHPYNVGGNRSGLAATQDFIILLSNVGLTVWMSLPPTEDGP